MYISLCSVKATCHSLLSVVFHRNSVSLTGQVMEPSAFLNGEGTGTQLQYSGLENPMDGGD